MLVLMIAVVALAALRCWRTLLVAVLALGLNVVVVAPVFTGHQASAAPGSPSLTIAHLNLQSRIGDLPGIHRWLETKPADIVVFLHATEPTAELAAPTGVRSVPDDLPGVRRRQQQRTAASSGPDRPR